MVREGKVLQFTSWLHIGQIVQPPFNELVSVSTLPRNFPSFPLSCLTVNIGVYVLFEHLFSIPLDPYAGVEMLGHMVTLCLSY